MKVCSVSGCGAERKPKDGSARGMCSKHYQRWRKNGDPLVMKIERHRHATGAWANRKSPTYNTWRGVIGRCENPRQPMHRLYGAVGVRMCERWRESFTAFLDDMGERPPGTTLDRIDNSGDYEPKNCRWADAKTQSRNRSTAHMLTFLGRTQNLSAWAEELQIPRSRICNRLRNGWPVDRALSAPVGAKRCGAD